MDDELKTAIDKCFNKDQVAEIYSNLIISHYADIAEVDEYILKKYSMWGLGHIKREAWKKATRKYLAGEA